jgi:hypothetical protein
MNIRFLSKKNIDIKNTKEWLSSPVLSCKKSGSVLFSRGKRSENFFTEDSGLYITPREQKLLRKGIKIDRRAKKWDSISSRIVHNFVCCQPSKADGLLEILEKRYRQFAESTVGASENFVKSFSLVRLWNLSVIGSILLGMVLMTFVYRYMGQGASAQQVLVGSNVQTGQVLGEETSADDAQAFADQVLAIEKINDQQSLEKEIRDMVKGYPIAKMVPYIAQKDRTVAAFLIAIARKESSWGVHVPVLNGQDCYNYWGYRGLRLLMGTGGHTCFNSPEDAVDTVSKRLATLIDEYGKNTPEKMVIWKCGSDCEATGGQAAANKWISDVTMYFDRLNEE